MLKGGVEFDANTFEVSLPNLSLPFTLRHDSLYLGGALALRAGRGF